MVWRKIRSAIDSTPETMNIFAPPGSKVVFAHPTFGDDYDIKKAREFLCEGTTYTVSRTEIFSSFTEVFLQEFPGVPFNSVQFEDVKKC
ncbi:hypothetical protein ACFFH2_15735 [Enterococcus devriesei]|uniref:hypothetical protein n=1 Tax=Enterococcus devriesei TaxID=319970 RepID=UPI00090016BB|nr:hypothetical protein [Enterococcus devriesei]